MATYPVAATPDPRIRALVALGSQDVPLGGVGARVALAAVGVRQRDLDRCVKSCAGRAKRKVALCLILRLAGVFI